MISPCPWSLSEGEASHQNRWTPICLGRICAVATANMWSWLVFVLLGVGNLEKCSRLHLSKCSIHWPCYHLGHVTMCIENTSMTCNASPYILSLIEWFWILRDARIMSYSEWFNDRIVFQFLFCSKATSHRLTVVTVTVPQGRMQPILTMNFAGHLAVLAADGQGILGMIPMMMTKAIRSQIIHLIMTPRHLKTAWQIGSMMRICNTRTSSPTASTPWTRIQTPGQPMQRVRLGVSNQTSNGFDFGLCQQLLWVKLKYQCNLTSSFWTWVFAGYCKPVLSQSQFHNLM